MFRYQEEVEIEGHLIDSGILKYTFDKIVELEGQFEVLRFDIGKNNQQTSKARLMIKAQNQRQLQDILAALEDFGGVIDREDCQLVPAERDRILPSEFYSTTNFETFIKIQGEWHPVINQKMDAVIIWSNGKAITKKIMAE